jgi:hypothetical protein
MFRRRMPRGVLQDAADIAAIIKRSLELQALKALSVTGLLV